MGFDWKLGKAFFLIGRTVGLTAHVYEEKTDFKPMRKLFDVNCDYEGIEERNLPNL
jgi:citryl-CoA lyase